MAAREEWLLILDGMGTEGSVRSFQENGEALLPDETGGLTVVSVL